MGRAADFWPRPQFTHVGQGSAGNGWSVEPDPESCDVDSYSTDDDKFWRFYPLQIRASDLDTLLAHIYPKFGFWPRNHWLLSQPVDAAGRMASRPRFAGDPSLPIWVHSHRQLLSATLASSNYQGPAVMPGAGEYAVVDGHTAW